MEKNPHGEWLCLRLETQVLNEFLIGQELYGNWSGSYQGSVPMRNSFNVFAGASKRQGTMRRSPCQLLRGSSFSSGAGGESSLKAATQSVGEG